MDYGTQSRRDTLVRNPHPKAAHMSFTPIPGQRVESYDLSARGDTDYYALFSDIPEADRAAWDRAKTFADEVIPVIDDYWDRG